jgi:hypothetical protein
MRNLQPRVIRRTHVMLSGVGLLACGAIFHELCREPAMTMWGQPPSAVRRAQPGLNRFPPNRRQAANLRKRVARNPYPALLSSLNLHRSQDRIPPYALTSSLTRLNIAPMFPGISA